METKSILREPHTNHQFILDTFPDVHKNDLHSFKKRKTSILLDLTIVIIIIDDDDVMAVTQYTKNMTLLHIISM